MPVSRTVRPRSGWQSPRHGLDRHRRRSPPPLWGGGGRRPRPRGRERGVRARPLQRHHGPFGLRQVNADAHPGWSGQAHLGDRHARREGAHRARRRRLDEAAARQARLRLPVLQPDPRTKRRGERRPAALDRGPQARRRVARAADRHRRARRAADSPSGRALGRRAAAGGAGAGAGVEAGCRVRRRADRQPRLQGERGGAPAAAAGGRRVRPDRGDGHPRPGGGLVRRPARRAARRPGRPRRRRRDRRGGDRVDEGRGVTRVALRGLASRKLRAFTTWLAVFLGIALVAGTYVLTDTINESFSEIFSESLKGTDVAVTTRQDIQTDDATPPAFPAPLLDRVRRVDGVAAAAGSVFAVGRFVDAKGDPIGHSFAPNFIASLLPDRFETLEVVEGRAPRSTREVTIDTQTADTGDLRVGSTMRLAGTHEAKSYEVVGLTKLGDTSFGGAGIAELPLAEAQRITDREGQFDQISVAAEDGVSAEVLRDRIARVMPRQVLVETGEEAAQR